MSIADWVDCNCICAVLSFFATILIGAWQIKQNNRMSKMERQQIDTEKKRYEESVETGARRFIVKYNDCIGLLPLCGIAYAYNPNRAYSRAMYSEFCLLHEDIRAEIFKRCGWRMCDAQTEDFFSDCLNCLKAAFEKHLSIDEFNRMFYEKGKYIEKAILQHASKKIPLRDEREKSVSDILTTAFRNKSDGSITNVIEQVIQELQFRTCDEIVSCQIACLVAQYISIYTKTTSSVFDDGISSDYGCPGGWAHEEIETMEDLFLIALFEIWVNLWDLKRSEDSDTSRYKTVERVQN